MTQPSLLDFAHGPAEFDPHGLTIAPSVSPAARETSALAAVENLPRKATQCETVLRLITAAGETGISDLELQRASGMLRSSLCARRRDLASLIEPAGTRYTAHGRSYCRWRRV